MTEQTLAGPGRAPESGQLRAAAAPGPVSVVQSREERLRILDEYVELAIEAELRDSGGGRWDDLGREF